MTEDNTLTKIARGWYHFIAATPDIKALMETRLRICDECPEKQQISSVGKVIVRGVNRGGSLYSCKACGCPLSPKTADPKGRCPLSKW